jgi:hypothetical protein
MVMSALWLAELRLLTADGAVASTQNGPRCSAAAQLPAASQVRRWEYQLDSVSDRAFRQQMGVCAMVHVHDAVRGRVPDAMSISTEYPATPEKSSVAPLHENVDRVVVGPLSNVA